MTFVFMFDGYMVEDNTSGLFVFDLFFTRDTDARSILSQVYNPYLRPAKASSDLLTIVS